MRMGGVANLVMMGGGGVMAGASFLRSKGSQESFFKGAKYTDKVKAQIELGDFHSFPEIVRNFESQGFITVLNNKSGTFIKLEIPGSYKGKDGVFEFIKNEFGEINHRFFKVIAK